MAPLRYTLFLLGLILLTTCSPDAVLCRPDDPSEHQSSPSAPQPRAIDGREAYEIIERLRLVPNAERGYYVQSFEDPCRIPGLNRSASTAIYYLLEGRDGASVWHRVDAAEVWHHYAGAPLLLSLAHGDGHPLREVTLGPDIFCGQTPQLAIQKSEWQRARSLGDWTLVGTTVAPGFVPGGVELADPGWSPDVS